MRSISAEAERGRERAEAHEEARPEAVGEAPGALGEREHDERRGHQREPGLERVVAGHLLQEEHQEEERHAQAAVHRERLQVADREVAPLEEPERQHRRRRALLVPQEDAEQDDARRCPGPRPRSCPSRRRAGG